MAPRYLRRYAFTWLIFIMVAAPGLGSGRFALADFADGLAAFDAGDFKQAYEHWLPLAEAGNPQAQVALAGLLESGGRGVDRNLEAAARWYRKAALNGDIVARVNLGQLYADGRGVRHDRICALAWLTLAAEQGHGWAARRSEAIATGMSPNERTEGASLASRIRSAGRSRGEADPCSGAPAEE